MVAVASHARKNLVAECIGPPKVYNFSSIGGCSIPKSVKRTQLLRKTSKSPWVLGNVGLYDHKGPRSRDSKLWDPLAILSR